MSRPGVRPRGWCARLWATRAPTTAWCSARSRSSRSSPLLELRAALPDQGGDRRPHPPRRLGGARRSSRRSSSLVLARALRAADGRGLPHAAHRPARDPRPARGAVRATCCAWMRASSIGTRSGRLMTRVLNDVEAMSEVFTSGIFAIVADVVTLSGVVAIMLWMDWHLALVTFALVPVLGVAAAYFRVRARDAYREVRTPAGPAQRVPPGVAAGHGGDPALRPRGARARDVPRSSTPRIAGRSSARRSSTRRSTRRWRPSARSRWRCCSGTGAAQIAGRGPDLRRRSSPSSSTPNRFFLPIRDLGAKYTVMQAAMVSAERIFALLDDAPGHRVTARRRRSQPRRGGGPGAPPSQGVWFAYEDEQWVLRDCSFAVAPGEHVALVGPTGEGKTHVRAAAEPRLRRARAGGCSWTASTCASGTSSACAGTSASSPRRSSSRARSRRTCASGGDGAVERPVDRSARCEPANASAFVGALPGRARRGAPRARRQSLARAASAPGHRPSPHV